MRHDDLLGSRRQRGYEPCEQGNRRRSADHLGEHTCGNIGGTYACEGVRQRPRDRHRWIRE